MKDTLERMGEAVDGYGRVGSWAKGLALFVAAGVGAKAPDEEDWEGGQGPCGSFV